MEMSMTMIILGVGMPALTLILLILTALTPGIFQAKSNLIWGLLMSLGLFDIAMILEHTGMVSQGFLAWSHIVLPIGALMIYLGLKKN